MFAVWVTGDGSDLAMAVLQCCLDEGSALGACSLNDCQELHGLGLVDAEPLEQIGFYMAPEKQLLGYLIVEASVYDDLDVHYRCTRAF